MLAGASYIFISVYVLRTTDSLMLLLAYSVLYMQPFGSLCAVYWQLRSSCKQSVDRNKQFGGPSEHFGAILSFLGANLVPTLCRSLGELMEGCKFRGVAKPHPSRDISQTCFAGLASIQSLQGISHAAWSCKQLAGFNGFAQSTGPKE